MADNTSSSSSMSTTSSSSTSVEEETRSYRPVPLPEHEYEHFDASKFQVPARFVALVVPVRLLNEAQRRLKGHLTHRLKPVIPDDQSHDEEAPTKLMVLDEPVNDLELSGLPAPLREWIQSNGIAARFHDVTMDYHSFSTDQLIAQCLPDGIDPLTAFETIGHIAHVNLREHHEKYKHLIGEVILIKNPRLKTVVNKLGSIHATFRTFDMEVIAGEPNFETEVSECKCRFKLNYQQVYWNSRLGMEHQRVVDALSKNDVVCDMFCGIGPFALPAAKKGCQVYANDLNPMSIHWLQVNIKHNKVGNRVRAFNLDARDFVRQLVANGTHFDKVIMNLPVCGELFLDVFVGLFPRTVTQLPHVFCYGFSSAPNPKKDFAQRVDAVLGTHVESRVFEVRDVAPQKLMLCAMFQLPAAVCYQPDIATTSTSAAMLEKRPSSDRGDGGDVPAAKKHKASGDEAVATSNTS